MTRATLALCGAAIAALLAMAPPAEAARRLAIVVGNDTYENVPVLEKARNDARAMSAALSGLGYDVVSAEDVGRRAMSRALVDIEGKISGGETVLMFFAGHGFAIDGTNFLLPVDVPAAGPGEEGLVRDAAFSASAIADRLREKGAATVIMILDACRDNPFAQGGTRAISGTRGLTRMDPTEGMFVLFSAGSGQAALDRLGDGDAHPNSVFTRVLLDELNTPGETMVAIAKSTQARVRDLAQKIGHNQTPAYYDQIIGDLYIAEEGASAVAGTGAGALTAVTEGGGSSVLPDIPEQRLAALQIEPEPVANFMRSNAGWTVTMSLPEAAIQFGYRVGEDGEWTDPGLMDSLDQRTGLRMPKTFFNLPPDQASTTLYVTWRDPRGEQADIYPVSFDPNASVIDGQKQILEDLWSAWLSFRDYNGLLVYFTHLVSYRCAIKEVHFGLDQDDAPHEIVIPPCNFDRLYEIPDGATVYRTIPPSTKRMTLQLTYVDGTKSEIRTFNVPEVVPQ